MIVIPLIYTSLYEIICIILINIGWRQLVKPSRCRNTIYIGKSRTRRFVNHQHIGLDIRPTYFRVSRKETYYFFTWMPECGPPPPPTANTTR